jgi:hypothetical protein
VAAVVGLPERDLFADLDLVSRHFLPPVLAFSQKGRFKKIESFQPPLVPENYIHLICLRRVFDVSICHSYADD